MTSQLEPSASISSVIKSSKSSTQSNCKSLDMKKLSGRTVQKDYILNDISALKKKVRHETRPEAFDTGSEASNGSNVVIQMKTSFFEHVKKQG